MRVVITSQEDYGKWVAYYILQKIRSFSPTEDSPFILGLPTGGTPLPMYRQLIKFYQDGLLSFRHVITFNMDEYVGLDPSHPQSYHFYMYETFFKHIDISDKNINIPDGLAKDLKAEGRRYEECIRSYGGVHLFIGGVGDDGHLAFNEAGSSLQSRTRDKELTLTTRSSNARFFNNDIEQVPTLAMTIGVATFLDAQEVVIMASGVKKARAIKHAIEKGINHMWTISALQLHPSAILVIDEEAAYELKVKTYHHFKEVEKDYLNVDSLIDGLYR